MRVFHLISKTGKYPREINLRTGKPSVDLCPRLKPVTQMRTNMAQNNSVTSRENDPQVQSWGGSTSPSILQPNVP